MSILVIGSSNVDISVHTRSLPTPGETILGKNINFRFGGKGANQACACGRLGGDVVFLTSVGKDKYGKELIEHLSTCNVDVSRAKYSDKNATGTALIGIADNGMNAIVVVQGANLDCNSEYILQNEDCFENCNYVLLQMEIPVDAIETSIRLAKKYRKKIILNPAPANPKLNKRLYKYISYITPNETEVGIMAYGVRKRADLMNAASKLLEDGVENVVITLGSKGSTLYRRNQATIKVPPYKVKAIDTVAAGDCFNGAFAVAIEQGKTVLDSLRFANLASAISVTRYGAQESIPTKEEIMSFVDKFEETNCTNKIKKETVGDIIKNYA